MPARQRAPGSFEKTSAPHAAPPAALARASPINPDGFQSAPSWFSNYEIPLYYDVKSLNLRDSATIRFVRKTSAPPAASPAALARIFERLSIPSPAATFYGAHANFASRSDAFQGAPSWFYELSNPAAALHRQTTILVSPSCALVCFEKLSASHAAFPAAFIRTSSVVLTPSKARHRGLFRKASIPPTFPFHDTRADFSCCPCHLQKRAIVVLRIKKPAALHCQTGNARKAKPRA